MNDHARAPRRRVVTQRDVAEAAGVDRATVSRALDPQKRLLISPETVTRVLGAAERMGYQANALARGLRTARSGIIGLEIPTDLHDAASMFDKPLSVFVTSIEERLRASGKTLLVAFAQPEPDSDDAGQFSRNGVIDGLIRMQSQEAPLQGVHHSLPTVTVGLDPAHSYDLVIDEGRGVEIAVEHLYRQGHRRIALVSEPVAQPRGERHVRAYRRTMQRLGLGGEDATTSALIAHFHERHPASAPKAVETILSRDDAPTAIVFTDDKAAMGGYGVLRAQRVQVPTQISIVGWRDNDAGPFLVPPLTTIALPMRATAFAATDLLLARVEADEHVPAEKQIFEPYLIQRESTAPAA